MSEVNTTTTNNENKVYFAKMSEAKFNSLTMKDNGTFYRVTTENGQDFYLGDQKLNNSEQITSAIASLMTEGGAIKDINDTLAAIQGDETTEGSIKKQVRDAITTINDIIGTVPEGSTVMGELQKATSAIKENADAIDVLNGDVTKEGSVKKQVADAVAAIVSDAPEAYDTLKEISDWISDHADSASAMNTQITDNKNNITKLTKLIGTLPEDVTADTVVAYIKEAVDAAIASLDSTISATEGSVLTGITITDGKITEKTERALGTAAGMDAEDFDAAGAASAVLGTESDTADKVTVYGVKAAVDAVTNTVTNTLIWNEVE